MSSPNFGTDPFSADLIPGESMCLHLFARQDGTHAATVRAGGWMAITVHDEVEVAVIEAARIVAADCRVGLLAEITAALEMAA